MTCRPPTCHKGRGASSNPAGRFEQWERHREDEERTDEDEVAPGTTVVRKRASSIISRNDSPDIPFSQSINPYQGCEHGCVYCYARPRHAYLGFSPGLDFETRIFAKENAAEVLSTDPARPGHQCELIALGANTDPYQPAERNMRITRSVLELLLQHRHPVGIVTKSSLIERDIDVLAAMAKLGLVRAFISIATPDAEVARTLEPRATAPWRRIETIRALTKNGIPCGVFAAPIVPFVTDAGMERVIEAAAAAGATSAGYVILRLPHEVKQLFREWMDVHYPLGTQRVIARVMDMRGGRENDSAHGKRMRGEGETGELISMRFHAVCRRNGLDTGVRFKLDTTQFSIRPSGPQMPLFS